MLKGVIVKNISNTYTVFSDNKSYVCTPRGRFRNTKVTPLVGDTCVIDEENGYILELLPRKNELKRPRVCNVDYGLIVASLKEPDLKLTLLDKEITSILLADVKPVICFTKLDLVSDLDAYQSYKEYYERIGIPCFNNQHLSDLITFLKGSIVVLTGQTGAGKSSLLNRIDSSFNLKTDTISHALNRGKHTTRHTEIYWTQDIAFCDTPGFSALEITGYSKEEVKATFKEFESYECKFKDCMHLKETHCAVKDAVYRGEILPSRYASYEKMIEECMK